MNVIKKSNRYLYTHNTQHTHISYVYEYILYKERYIQLAGVTHFHMHFDERKRLQFDLNITGDCYEVSSR